MRVKELPKYELTEKEIKKVNKIISGFLERQGALIPVLQAIQKEIGFLPIDILKKVSEILQIPEKDVYGVVTFYSFFTMIPKGDINIRVCMGTACYVKGGKKIIDEIGKNLNIKPGETTKDRKYSLEANRCLGACGIAPVVVLNDKVCKKVDPKEIMSIIEDFKA